MKELNHKKELVNYLTKQMMEKISQLTALYVIEISNDEEAKKTLETTEFMNALFTGKNWPKKGEDFKERNKQLFSEVYSYNEDIKTLG